MTPAAVGAEQLVPETITTVLLTTTRKFIACAEMSGYPRPLGLSKVYTSAKWDPVEDNKHT
jgi:hypothetical protein